MKPPFKDWTTFYQQINFVFNAIIGITLLPFAWVFLELEKSHIEPKIIIESPWMIYVPITLLMGWYLNRSFQLTKKSISEIPRDQDERIKYQQYYQIQLRHYLILGIASAICLVFTYLLQVYFFAVLYIFILFLFSLNRPKYDRIYKDLGINN